MTVLRCRNEDAPLGGALLLNRRCCRWRSKGGCIGGLYVEEVGQIELHVRTAFDRDGALAPAQVAIGRTGIDDLRPDTALVDASVSQRCNGSRGVGSGCLVELAHRGWEGGELGHAR